MATSDRGTTGGQSERGRAAPRAAVLLLVLALFFGMGFLGVTEENRLLRNQGEVTTALVLSVHWSTSSRNPDRDTVRVRLEVSPGRAVDLDVTRFRWRAPVPGQVVLVRYAPDGHRWVVRDAAAGADPAAPVAGAAAVLCLVGSVLLFFWRPGPRRRRAARAPVAAAPGRGAGSRRPRRGERS